MKLIGMTLIVLIALSSTQVKAQDAFGGLFDPPQPSQQIRQTTPTIGEEYQPSAQPVRCQTYFVGVPDAYGNRQIQTICQ